MAEQDLPIEVIRAVAERHGCTVEVARDKISITQITLLFGSPQDAADFLLKTKPREFLI